MLAGGENHPAEGHHALFSDRVTDHRECLRAHLVAGNDVVGIADVQLVDFLFRNKFIDVDEPRALKRDRFQLLVVDFNVIPLADLVAFYNIVLLDLAAGLRIHLLVADTITRLFVDLMKSDLLAFRTGRKECDRAGDE